MTAPSASKKQPAGELGQTRTVRFRIKRCDGPGKPSRWESFDVQVAKGEGANVLACLQRIAANPVTIDGTMTTPVAWDSGCLEEVCGACTMVINGRVRQSCSCLVDTYAPGDGDVITLEPMQKFPVVRDLFVDRARMFETRKRIKGWVPIDGLYATGAGPKESPEDQQIRYIYSTCMSCGCCLDACPQYQLEPDEKKWSTSFVGASEIGQVRLFNLHKTGAELAKDRLDAMLQPGGITTCGQAQNCVKVCPRDIPLTDAIGAIGRAATIHGLKRFFQGK